MFYTLSKAEIRIFVTFNLLSANAFNLVWSKILSCGNGLSLYATTKVRTQPTLYSTDTHFDALTTDNF